MIVVAAAYLNEVEEVLRTVHLRVDLLDKGAELLLITESHSEELAVIEAFDDVGVPYIYR